MNSTTKKLLLLGSVLLGMFIGIRYLLPLIFPFLLGGALALAAEPLVKFLCRRLRLPRGAAAGIGVGLSFVFLAMAVLLPHVMEQYGAAARKRLAELAEVCGITGSNDAEKAEAFLRWIRETNEAMGIPTGFSEIRPEDIEQMITWARKEAHPLYPVPVVWGTEDFRKLIESIRK